MKNLVYPDICIICKKFFENSSSNYDKSRFPKDFREVFGDVLCCECLDRIFFANCGLSGFPGEKSYLDSVISPFLYRDSIVDIVHLLKYNDKIFLAEKISWFILKSYIDLYKEEFPDLALFVPMHKKAFRKRGFNQTYLIAWKTFKLAETNRIYFPEVHKNILLKTKNTMSQAELKKEERLKNISNAFNVNNPCSVKGKRILIIDDVCTTGSTLEECAKTLVKSGARSVDAITFARAV
jgi:ComF family protein